MATKKIEKIANIFTRYLNPLRNLSQVEIDRLLQNARLGDDIRLQLAYFEIERSTPIFSVCINKRLSGMQNRKWDITPINDTPQAKAQAEKVKAMFNKSDTLNEDGLTEALRHLDLATFRGRAAVKPFIDDNGDLFFKKLENWNFVRHNGHNYWNPKSMPTFVYNGKVQDFEKIGLEEIPKDEVAYIVEDKNLDWCGIAIYLRQIIGEEAWARAVEKYGVAQVLLTAPEGTPDTDLEKWNYRAQAIFEGASGTLPNGTDVKTLTEARAQDPFSNYIQHQMEQFVILATGSTLATLGGTSGSTGGGMGSDIASTQNDQFTSLVNYDCKRIANALQVAVDKCVKASFGDNAETLVRFQFIEDDNVKPMEYLELAEKCKALGIKVDVQKLKEITGLQFIGDEEADVWTPIKSGDEQ